MRTQRQVILDGSSTHPPLPDTHSQHLGERSPWELGERGIQPCTPGILGSHHQATLRLRLEKKPSMQQAKPRGRWPPASHSRKTSAGASPSRSHLHSVPTRKGLGSQLSECPSHSVQTLAKPCVPPRWGMRGLTQIWAAIACHSIRT